MRQFKWIEWNLDTIDAHALSAEDLEASFDRVFRLEERRNGSSIGSRAAGICCLKTGRSQPMDPPRPARYR
jgi:hypothetical protein